MQVSPATLANSAIFRPAAQMRGSVGILLMWPMALWCVLLGGGNHSCLAQAVGQANHLSASGLSGPTLVNDIDLPLLDFGSSLSGRPSVINKYIFRPGAIATDWFFQSSIFYRYDLGLRPITITEINRRGDTLRRKAYDYHPLSKVMLVERVQVYSNRLGWQDSVEIAYFYDNVLSNTLRVKQISNLKGPANTLPTQTLFAYRPDGKPHYIRQRREVNRRWIELSAEYFSYNAAGLEVSRSLYEFDGPDSVLTLRTYKTFDYVRPLTQDSIFRAINYWQYANKQVQLLRSDTLILSNPRGTDPPKGWTETYFNAASLVTRRVRYANVTFSTYVRNNIPGSTLLTQTEQTWNGNRFVDNSRTNYQSFASNAVSIVREVAANNVFTPAERYQAPFDTFRNSLGTLYERWNTSQRAWVFNPRQTSTVIRHRYDLNSSQLVESVISVTDTAANLHQAFLLEYLNYVVSAPKQAQQVVKLLAYPNPATDQIKVDLPAMLSGEPVRILIQNALGQMVLTMEDNGSSPVINVSSLPDGIYILNIVRNQGNQGIVGTAKFVKRP